MSIKPRCTACTNDATRTAPHAGTVDFAGVLAEIHKDEGLCGPCLQQLQPRNHRRRTRIVWEDDGIPTVVTTEVRVTKFVDIKLRVPHGLKEEIRAKARAEGLSLNAWAGVVLHAAAHGLPFAFEKEAAGE